MRAFVLHAYVRMRHSKAAKGPQTWLGVSGFHGIVVHNSQIDLLASSRSKPKTPNEMLSP